MANDYKRLVFVYYCSGHGYGHATRVSAFASHLLRLDIQPTVYIVSSAPKHVFSDSVALGVLYRNANIDPVIVQPLAYRVDRRKSVEVLEHFLSEKDRKVADESQWLRSINADCVLSDAAFLGCLAANEAGVPSILITNFSFDSVYSYLSTPFIDEPLTSGALAPPPSNAQDVLEPDVPISLEELSPLVEQIHSGYRCADLLLRLPGAIPLPSFALHPGLPSPQWVDHDTRAFKAYVVDHLTQPPSTYKLHPQIPFPSSYPPKALPREVRTAPLLVRPTDPAVYTQEGRSRLLDSIGIPVHLHDHEHTKILIVSFGGQVFHKPHSRSHSRAPSKAQTPRALPDGLRMSPTESAPLADLHTPLSETQESLASPEQHAQALSDALKNAALSRTDEKTPSPMEVASPVPPRAILTRLALDTEHHTRPRGLSQLRVAGAPPAAVPTSPKISTQTPAFLTIPPTPRPVDGFDAPEPCWNPEGHAEAEADARILPDESWIAIVCGVPQDWGREDGEELPENFFVAPRDVYMPDLTAVADVLLGKLGYGTVSECVDACTPFVYVPRPLFIEEHGLRLYLEREGVGVELSRTAYEQGEWADAIEAAWCKGREAKARKRAEGETGRRSAEGRQMACEVVEWVRRWKAGVGEASAKQDAVGDSIPVGQVALSTGLERLRSSDGMGHLN
ncbi:hypothetical protein BN946_scf184979.g54 [Trametes cinnabarina]|uniref:Uncharacterized protein n=1 Tax=Pycnoporus cinnabarinus TaxID=5643 RepID=A0A060SQJ5_PYCCI|nr:hypothetical protein BN946_scf184979.g54 [Trametes cinnabarina]